MILIIGTNILKINVKQKIVRFVLKKVVTCTYSYKLLSNLMQKGYHMYFFIITFYGESWIAKTVISISGGGFSFCEG